MFEYEKSEFLFWYIRIKSKISEQIFKLELKLGSTLTKSIVILIGALLSIVFVMAPVLILRISLNRNIWIIVISFLVLWYYISLPFFKLLKKNHKITPKYKLKIKSKDNI